MKRSTLQSILDLFGAPVLPYKVFTGLVSQAGVDNLIDWFAGALTKGVTYKIYGNGGDYANVGAPNNNNGTYFIATSNEVPTSYNGTYVQYNEGAPTVTILENTLGNVWFTYSSDLGAGAFPLFSNDLFTVNKTFGTVATVYDNANAVNLPVFLDLSGLAGGYEPTVLVIKVIGGDNGGNSLLNQTPIEIRVYD